MAMTQKEKLLKLLLDNYDGVTSRLARNRGISSAKDRVRDLREEGFLIWTNLRKNKRTGKKEYSFRLDNNHRY